MMETIDFAPLDGITKVVFRQMWHQHFGGVDRYFIPFFSPTPHHLMTPRDLREVGAEANAGLPSVPQVMTRNAEDFLWACHILQDLGYGEVNLNLGCPSGTVTAKGKGSGFLAHPEELAAFLDTVFAAAPLPVSVKTRLGYDTPEEFPALLEIFNRYPIACLTVHPRVRREKYRGAVHLDAFALALRESRNPVCYNGDLRTVEEVRQLEARFPTVSHGMIGRGLVADPALARKLRGGEGAGREEIRAFLEDLYQSYTAFYQGQAATAAQRMREVWFYLIHLFAEAEALNKRLRRFRTPEEYLQIQSEILARCPLRADSCGDLI